MPENRNRSRDRRFLHRAFTPDEQALIGRMSKAPDAVLWALWAGKEGAYKAVSRHNPGISSAPRRYQVRFLADDPETGLDCSGEAVLSGFVQTPAGEVSFQTYFTPQYVHCLVVTGGDLPDDRLIFHVLHRQGPSDHSDMLRLAAARRLSSLLAIDPALIEIHRSRTSTGFGAPCILVAGRKSEIAISLSHDGCYGAFALLC